MFVLVNVARVVFAPLLQPAAAEFGVSPASLGVVASAAWFGSAALRLPTGWLLTRVSRHRVIAVSGGWLVTSATLATFVTSVRQLVAGAFLMGLASGVYIVAAQPLISELFPEAPGRKLGIHGMWAQVAAVGVPVLVSGALLAGNWRTTFVAIAAGGVVATVGLVWAAKRTSLPEAGVEDRSLVAAGRAQVHIILTGIAFLGAIGFLWNGIFNLYGDYLEVTKGIDPETGRLLLSTMFGAGIPAFLIGGRLADRVSNVALLLSIGAGLVVSTLLLTIVEGIVLVVVVTVLIGFIVHMVFPTIDTYMLSTLPDYHRASAYSVFSASMMLFQAMGSGVIGTAVARGVGYDQAFQTVALAIGGIVVGLFVLHRAGKLPYGGERADGTTTLQS